MIIAIIFLILAVILFVGGLIKMFHDDMEKMG